MQDKEKVFIEDVITLFQEYEEDFGLCTECDGPTSDMVDSLEKLGKYYKDNFDYSERQCIFEDKFRALVCQLRGHDLIPDQCGRPEHDFCTFCNIIREDLDAKAIGLII